MSRLVLTVVIAVALVLTAGLGSAARACGVAPAATQAAQPCHETSHQTPEPSQKERDMGPACQAICALGAAIAGEPPRLASAPLRWVDRDFAASAHVQRLSADLTAEDPPPRLTA